MDKSRAAARDLTDLPPGLQKLVAKLVFLKWFCNFGYQGLTAEVMDIFIERMSQWISVDTKEGTTPLPVEFFSKNTGMLELLRERAIVLIRGHYHASQWAADALEHDWPWARQFITGGVRHFVEFGAHPTPTQWEAAPIPDVPIYDDCCQDPLRSVCAAREKIYAALPTGA